MNCPICGAECKNVANNRQVYHCWCGKYFTDWQQSKINDLQAHILYEQERNQNNVDNAEHLIAHLEDALRNLTNEAQGFLSMAEKETHGQTNINVLQLRIKEAKEALDEKAE